ncbi:14850_t:CDS:2 [Acaulospora morrowiae]|uniref:14850_t:CDS:1 n=1 Tax=Acaulospora morrowiae TaxID=94023 RepID=A0A9N9BID5_9GLOM|nr:14850_t:CDS:2 [Acaulospora morrowiae]
MVSNLRLNRIKSAFTLLKNNLNNREWISDSPEREWTSGNLEVDELIKSTQSPERKIQQLEWIPYKELRKIKQIGEGGFSKIFVSQWDRLSEKCCRFVVSGSAEERRLDGVDKRVILKQLKNSANITSDFLKELKTYYTRYSRDYGFFLLLRYYGISKDPLTNEYIIVMEYCEHGSLTSYLTEITEHFEVKLYVLVNMVRKINALHSFGIVHRDLHMGNILLDCDMTPHLSDMGLSGPANAEDYNRTDDFDENVRSSFLDLIEISLGDTHPEAIYTSRFIPYVSCQEN